MDTYMRREVQQEAEAAGSMMRALFGFTLEPTGALPTDDAQAFEMMRNQREPTPMEVKLSSAKAWLAERERERGRHVYVPGMPSVLLPVALRAVQRVQERRHD